MPCSASAASECVVLRSVRGLRADRRACDVIGGGFMRVLVIDDCADTADMLSLLLRAARHDVRVAYCGRDGIAIARELSPEIALVDIQLADVSGHVVARELRKQALQRIHIVAVSGADSWRLPFAAVFDEHARKPMSAARLYQLLDTARDAARAQHH